MYLLFTLLALWEELKMIGAWLDLCVEKMKKPKKKKLVATKQSQGFKYGIQFCVVPDGCLHNWGDHCMDCINVELFKFKK